MNSYHSTCCGISIDIHLTENSIVKINCSRCERVMFSFPGAQEKSHTRRVTNQDELLRHGVSSMLLDKYQIVKTISDGSLSKVYLALDSETKEKIAIKVLKFKKIAAADNNAKISNNFVKFFIREAEILTELNHHNIVKIKGTGNNKGNPYLVMEYIPGETLLDAIDQLPEDNSMMLLIIHRLASALEYGYENFKIIHRDIKPQNVILAREKENMPMLVDFGLAKSLGNHYHSLTLKGVITGTPNYMPHEHFTQDNIDHRSDIYSLGATLYFMLTKHHPYHNIKDIVDIFHAIKQKQLIPIQEFDPRIPPEVVNIVEKAMAFDQKDRYQDYVSLKKDIENFLDIK